MPRGFRRREIDNALPVVVDGETSEGGRKDVGMTHDARPNRERAHPESHGVFRGDPAAIADRPIEARWALRTGTRDLHDRAERALGDRATRDLGHYVRMLQANLRMTEATLRAIRPHLPAWMTQGLTDDCARLEADLARMGTGRPTMERVVPVHDRAAALGAAYVCEGARLGGRVLARRVREEIGFTADFGASYLNGGGADTGGRWRAFVEILNRELRTQGGIDRALCAARGVFMLIIEDYEDF
jgi:heme oxygenase